MNLLVDEHRRQKIAGRSHCRPEPPAVRSPSRRPGATKSDKLTRPRPICRHRSTTLALYDRSRRKQEAGDVFRCELNPDSRSKGIEAEDVQIFVEVA